MKPNRHRPEQWSQISAIGGGIAWLLLLAVPPASTGIVALIERLLTLAILVFTPLALALAALPAGAHRLARLYDIACYYQPFAAALTAGAFFIPAGPAAALFASSWL